MYNINEHIKKKLINKYRGSERKETVILDDGNTYLIKMLDKTREVNRRLSYINNAISEYLGCKIIESIGLDVQEVKLGEYKTTSTDGENKSYIVCACKDFVPIGYSLAEAEITSLGSENSKSAKDASFETIKNISNVIEGISENELMSFYAKQFIADALIGNKDRHNGNWGFITGPKYNKIAPIYDCGSSLCPLLDDSELTENKARNMAINSTSVIVDHEERIHYFDYISSGKNRYVTNALKEMLPSINLNTINRIIDETPYISEKRKSFYKEYEKTAYENNLLQSFYLIQKRDIEPNTKENNDILYAFYKHKIKDIKELETFEKIDFEIKDFKCQAMKASNKFALIIKDGKAIGVLPIRSNSEEIREAIDILSKISGIERLELISVATRESSYKLPGNENLNSVMGDDVEEYNLNSDEGDYEEDYDEEDYEL